MSKKANPTLIGVFVIGAVVLLLGGAMLFGGADMFAPKSRWLTYFPNSVSGLRVGANVLFRGVRVGFVEAVQLQGDVDSLETHVRVTLRTFPGVFELTRQGEIVDRGVGERISADDLIEAGLKAQLGVESFVTGQLLVELDFHPDQEQVYRGGKDPEFPEIPTILTDIQQIVENVQRFAADLQESLDVQQLAEDVQSAIKGIDELANSEDLRASLAGLNRIVNAEETQAVTARLGDTLAEAREAFESVHVLADNADTELGPMANELKSAIARLDGTLAEAESTLAGASAQMHGDTELARQIVATLAEAESAARSLRVFMDLIERHPEALIQGKP